MSAGVARPYRPTALDVVAGHDLHGRTALVTGGASGIGLETVRALATAGARVVVTVRDERAAAPVIERLREETRGAAVELAVVDLAALSGVAAFTAAFTGPLDLVVANAGVMACPRAETADGYERQLGTNHLGHFALVTGLIPALRAGAARHGGARVVVLSSSAHRRSDIRFADPQFRSGPYDPWVAYGQSKTANALFAVGLTGRYRGDGITANALNPGLIATGLQRHLSWADQVARGFYDEDGRLSPRFKTPEQGAATTVWAAVAAELGGVGGEYLEDCAIASPYDGSEPFSGYLPYARNPERADRLWRLSTDLLGGG
jgi:NAD(P)-dependent dehydrogenase (short-subunit alcohol dehydrogenase family)